ITTFGRIAPSSSALSPVRWMSDIIRVGMLAPSSCRAMNSSLSVIGFSAGSRCSLIVRAHAGRVIRAKILAKPASAHRRLLLVRYDDGGACADGLLRDVTAFNARGARERCPSLRAQRGER